MNNVSVGVYVQVPRRSDVRLRSRGGGISIRNIEGTISGRTAGGKLELENLAGRIELTTAGGDIRIDEVGGWVEARTGAGTIEVTMNGQTGDGERDVTLISGLGDIWLTLPDGILAGFDVELGYTHNSSQDFEIRSDFDLVEERTGTWDDSQGTPRKYIRGSGTVGRGGNLIRIRTTNGDVHLIRGGRP